MAIDAQEIMIKISGPEPIQGAELDGVFKEVQLEWAEARLAGSPSATVLGYLMREVGKRFPEDDPRNPDSTVYQH